MKDDLIKIIDKKIFFIFFASAILLDFLSFIGYLFPLIMNLCSLFLIIFFLILSLKDLRWGIMAIIAELLLGVYGYLFVIKIGNILIPIRYLFFIVWLSIFFVFSLKEKKFFSKFRPDNFFLFIGIIFIIFSGLLIGLLSGNSLFNIFFDVNGWFFWLYFLPFSIFILPWEKIWPFFLSIITWLAVKTLFFEFVFSHKLPNFQFWLYQWQRDFRLVEITPISGALSRVFSQSQIFLIIPFFILLLYFVAGGIKKLNHQIKAIACLFLFLTSALYISYSRSFWLGIILSLILFLSLLLFQKEKYINIKVRRIIFLPILFIFSSLVLVYTLVNFPYPPTLQSGFDSLLTARFGHGLEEPAVNARLKLLPPLLEAIKPVWFQGSGFGTTVKYFSSDPRIIASSPGQSGEVTTFAFEWGYLDIWLKVGLLGLVIYLLILIKILVKLIKDAVISRDIFLSSLVLSFLALLVLNITTPYLNHPLGIGFIFLILLLSASYKDYKRHVGDSI